MKEEGKKKQSLLSRCMTSSRTFCLIHTELSLSPGTLVTARLRRNPRQDDILAKVLNVLAFEASHRSFSTRISAPALVITTGLRTSRLRYHHRDLNNSIRVVVPVQHLVQSPDLRERPSTSSNVNNSFVCFYDRCDVVHVEIILHHRTLEIGDPAHNPNHIAEIACTASPALVVKSGSKIPIVHQILTFLFNPVLWFPPILILLIMYFAAHHPVETSEMCSIDADEINALLDADAVEPQMETVETSVQQTETVEKHC